VLYILTTHRKASHGANWRAEGAGCERNWREDSAESARSMESWRAESAESAGSKESWRRAMAGRESFGAYLRALRVEQGITLREFCRTVDESPGNISRMERGKLNPPDSVDKLERFARALGIVAEDGIRNFIDLAVIDRGRIPEDILSDVQLAKALPLVFRTVRGQRLEDDDLRNLADLIKRS
jgi:transcriptional regulator with XRE-family HTH domain